MSKCLYVNKLSSFIDENNLFSPKDRILLAVSGGRDSSAMAYLFNVLNFRFAIAHCNFMLRQDESKKDEEFVKNIAYRYKVEYFVKSFDTNNYAKEHRLSIQEAARVLRYSWFNGLLDAYSFNYIATAHHKNDLVETILINILRHTGISGIKGFLPKKNRVIRPMLCFDSKDINTLVELQNISFREDRSNSSDKYLRNRLRKYVLPNFDKADNNFINGFSTTSKNLCDQELLLQDYVALLQKQLFKNHNDYIYINIADLKFITNYKIALYEILKQFGANKNIVNNLLYSLEHNESKQFLLDKFSILKSGSKIIIKENDAFKKTNNLDIADNLLFSVLHINSKILTEIYNNANEDIAYFDADKLDIDRLILRYWQRGDKMQILGMQSQKNISDILTDLKIDFVTKQKAMVLGYRRNIVWLVGYRISEKYKVSTNTRNVLQIKVKRNPNYGFVMD